MIQYDCLITHISKKDNLAVIQLICPGEEESFMEMPLDELEKENIEPKLGIMFNMKISLSQITNCSLSNDQIQSALEFYKDKYGDS